MNNLFSVFDPASAWGLSINWLSCGLIIVASPVSFWATNNTFSLLWGRTLKSLLREFSLILSPLSFPGLLGIVLTLFSFVFVNNFFGLFPYIFTARSHLSFTFALALPIWLGPVIIGWLITPSASLAHLVPAGSPGALAPFMVLIEITRNLIRPVALGVRLAANMVAGHLLLSLLRGIAPGAPLLTVTLVTSGLLVLITLELAVSIIQAYVISVLSTIYMTDVNSLKFR